MTFINITFSVLQSVLPDNLAKKVGVRRETILFIEKGNYNPSLKLAHDIAKALQTTIDDLFIFEDSNTLSTSKQK